MRNLDHWSTSRLLTTAARLVEHAWTERLNSIGVTHAGVIALGVLSEQGAMTQARLAEHVRVQAQTMGKTLSHLESRGCVLREPHDADRRSQLLSISAVGRQVLDATDDIEPTLVTDGSLASEEFRGRLAAIITELGASRWTWTTSADAAGTEPDTEDPTGSGSTAGLPSL
ncbi:MarR family transcriptional regulator [Arthrobacter echini]|uniref:MarR family transcriptional regulator n=1 Tax=Arthrobacter echini TaxID=1529066 RepID=A0A4S5E451_9MICC|nr:MarR family transcriptional regulator [Arthrobacter echini]THJ66245.1 MarR family transcriptional regulator [Arthrobacter echini]